MVQKRLRNDKKKGLITFEKLVHNLSPSTSIGSKKYPAPMIYVFGPGEESLLRFTK